MSMCACVCVCVCVRERDSEQAVFLDTLGLGLLPSTKEDQVTFCYLDISLKCAATHFSLCHMHRTGVAASRPI